MMKVILILASLAAMTGNASALDLFTQKKETGQEFSTAAVRQIVPGKTQDEVLALLGAPGQKIQTGQTTLWLYRHSVITRGVGIFTTSGSRQGQLVRVQFRDGVVRSCAFVESSTSSGGIGTAGYAGALGAGAAPNQMDCANAAVQEPEQGAKQE